MLGDFPDRLSRMAGGSGAGGGAARGVGEGRSHCAEAKRRCSAATEHAPPEPQAPRLRQNDVTIEKVATILATAAPKGLVIVRDELAGWLAAMNTYNDAGRAFWIEAYGGRPYRVERQKNPEPIDVPRLAVAVYGGTQPEKLAGCSTDADDGLFSRVAWFWPEPLPFRLRGGAECPMGRRCVGPSSAA